MIHEVGRASRQPPKIRHGKASSIQNMFYFGGNVLLCICWILDLFVRGHDVWLKRRYFLARLDMQVKMANVGGFGYDYLPTLFSKRYLGTHKEYYSSDWVVGIYSVLSILLGR
jgi:hypothetical protein